MKDLLKNFLKPKNILGCDVGASSVKFVSLKDDNGSLRLESFGMIDADILTENSVGLQRARAYIKEHGLYGKHACMNIEDKSLRIRRMDLPEMPKADMKVAIKWNFREYVDGPIEKYVVDYSDFGDMKVNGDRRPILAFASSNDSIEYMMKVAKHIGLKPLSVEPNATALLSVFDRSVGWEKDKFHVLLDLGGKIANFIVVGNGYLLFSRPINIAGSDTLIKSISKDMSASPEQAAVYLRSYLSGASIADDIKAKLRTTAEAFLSQVVVEIQRSVDAFCLQFHADKVDVIHLSGGGSLIPGICDYFTKNLGIVTKIFEPFKGIDTSRAGGNIPNAQLYAVAVGLAIPRE